jgi:hypothetical protein
VRDYEKIQKALHNAQMDKTLNDMSDDLSAMEDRIGPVETEIRKFARVAGNEDFVPMFEAIKIGMDEATKTENLRGMRLELLGIKEGWSDTEVQIRKFADTAGNTVKQTEAFAKEMRKIEGAKMTKSLETPMEQYRLELKHIDDMLKAGNITANTAARARQKEWEKVWGSQTTMGFADIGKKFQEVIMKEAAKGNDPQVRILGLAEKDAVVQRDILVAVQKSVSRGLK